MAKERGRCPNCGVFLTFTSRMEKIICHKCQEEMTPAAAVDEYCIAIKNIEKRFTRYQKYTEEINKVINRTCSYDMAANYGKSGLVSIFCETFKLQKMTTDYGNIEQVEGITEDKIVCFKNKNGGKTYSLFTGSELNEEVIKKLLQEFTNRCDEYLVKLDKDIIKKNRDNLKVVFKSLLKVIIVLLINFLLFKTGHYIFGGLCILVTLWTLLDNYFIITDHLYYKHKKRK